MIIYPDKDYSNIYMIQGKQCGKSTLLKEFQKAIEQSKQLNKPIEVECIEQIIEIKE